METVGEGRDGTNWDSSIEKYIAVCKIDSQWEFAVRCRELNMVLCDNLEGWDGVGSGREADICRPMADSC